jgi:branched-chain amino acid transport system substrate-binding protein
MFSKRLLVTVVALALAATGLVSVSCGSDEATTATGEPFKIAYNEDFTGVMSVDAALADHGIQTALKQLNSEVLGRPIEYLKADNGGDPVVAVDKARKLVESDGIQTHIGPIFAPSAAAVTDYLAKSGGIPEIALLGWSSENLKTANKLSFIPMGILSCTGYYFGKYVGEKLGYKTVSAIYFEDTAAHEIQGGFQKGFEEAGGTISACEYVPIDTMDFSPYLTTLPKADGVLYWVFGPGLTLFIQQYHQYSIGAPLISPMCLNLTEAQMAELGDIALGQVGVDYYSPELDNSVNKKFVEDYRAQWNGEYPQAQSAAGWIAVNLFVEAVKKTDGDTSPEALKKAYAGISLDTPFGPLSFVEYGDAWVGKGNLSILETKMVGDRMAWVPIETYEDVVFEDMR